MHEKDRKRGERVIVDAIINEQAEIIERLSTLMREVISELSQFKAVDQEEKRLEEILRKGGQN